MISFSDNIMFFSSLFIGVFGFIIAVLVMIYNSDKDSRKKPNKSRIHKLKKA